jgi:endoglucanase
MQQDSKTFLYSLLKTPSPSGFEQGIQKVVKKRMASISDEVSVDVHGNLTAAYNPDGKVRVMLAGHCDQIGMMVTHIDEAGFVYFNPIGGIDPSVLLGIVVLIHTRSGIVSGVIGHKPVHLIPAEERGKKIELSKLWIDLGVESGSKAKQLVSVGDAITFSLGVTELSQHSLAAPGCDDRVGVFVVMEALRLVAKEVKQKGLKKKFPVALFAVSTVQEEIGLRGAKTSCYEIDPLVGIAVDVTHASDNPGAEAKKIGTVKLGAGPTIARGPNINPVLENLLVATAKKKKINYQTLSAPGATGTDANVMQISRSGVASALIGIPNRYMHTPVEMVDLRDLEAAAKLIAQTVLSITSRMSFIPA